MKKKSAGSNTLRVLLTVGTLAACTVLLAPSAAAAQGPLAGTWTSVDGDGSAQTLNVSGSGTRAYSVVYRDEEATSACGGNPAQVAGPGYVVGEDLLTVGTIVCVPGGNSLGRIEIFYDYDAATDTLTDQFGIQWYRVG